MLGRGYGFYTVDLALAESLNAIWKHSELRKDLKPEDADAAIRDLLEVYDKLNIVATRDLAEKAVHITLSQRITVYDALYVAATQEADGTLYTADQKLHAAASKQAKSKLLKSI